jgi:hypothetical protein
MDSASTSAAKKRSSVSALRCLNPDCKALLAYEVDGTNALYVDLSWTARSEGDLRYFPCPGCGGKNVVEAVANEKGLLIQRVARWQP